MTRLVVCTPLLLMGLASALCSSCAQRDSRLEASREVSPEAQPPAEPEAAPEAVAPEATPRYRTVDLGYFNEMIEQFAAADTLRLRVEAHPQGFQLVRREFQLKRPGRFRAMHDFDGREEGRICDGKTEWMISPARREYVEMAVVPGKAPSLGLLPDLFQSAREIARGENRYARILAVAQRVESEPIADKPCDVIDIKLDEPPGTEARIWLSKGRRLPLRVRMISKNGVIDYDVRTLEIGVELDEATFTFTPGPDWTGGAVPAPPPPTPPAPSGRRSENPPAEPESSRDLPDASATEQQESATDTREQSDRE